MAKLMKALAAVFAALTVLFYYLNIPWAFITALTFSYHLLMRLAVGYIVNAVMKNRADYTKKRYKLMPFEQKLYKKLKVKKWKGKMPTYSPATFSVQEHSYSEIAGAMCQAETVHEIIVVLSFVPLFFAIPFGSFAVFLITSVVSAFYDLMFIIIQRFNRPRIIRLINNTTEIQ